MQHFLIRGGKDDKELYFLENQAERFKRDSGEERLDNDDYVLRRINLAKLTNQSTDIGFTVIRKGCFQVPTYP